jgi:hypothetical protein
MKKLFSFTLCLVFSQLIFAQTPNSTGTNSGSNVGPKSNPAIQTALRACASSVARDSNGHPDINAMHTCMSAKGFTPQHGFTPPSSQKAQ